jgi:hypothetical protein
MGHLETQQPCCYRCSLHAPLGETSNDRRLPACTGTGMELGMEMGMGMGGGLMWAWTLPPAFRRAALKRWKRPITVTRLAQAGSGAQYSWRQECNTQLAFVDKQTLAGQPQLLGASAVGRRQRARHAQRRSRLGARRPPPPYAWRQSPAATAREERVESGFLGGVDRNPDRGHYY